jgi:hypothetical protein
LISLSVLELELTNEKYLKLRHAGNSNKEFANNMEDMDIMAKVMFLTINRWKRVRTVTRKSRSCQLRLSRTPGMQKWAFLATPWSPSGT